MSALYTMTVDLPFTTYRGEDGEVSVVIGYRVHKARPATSTEPGEPAIAELISVAYADGKPLDRWEQENLDEHAFFFIESEAGQRVALQEAREADAAAADEAADAKRDERTMLMLRGI